MFLGFLAPVIQIKKVKTKPEKLTLDHFIQWLETVDGKQKYNYGSIQRCLLAQYIKYCYKSNNVSVGSNTWTVYDYGRWPWKRWKHGDLPRWFNEIAISNSTFEGALRMAKQIQSQVRS